MKEGETGCDSENRQIEEVAWMRWRGRVGCYVNDINEQDIWSVRPFVEGLIGVLLILGDKLIWGHVYLSLPRVLIQHPK